MSIAAVQARMVELQSAITAVTQPQTPAPAASATSGEFSAALANAVSGQSATAALGGQGVLGGQGALGAGGLGAAGLTSLLPGLTGAAGGSFGQSVAGALAGSPLASAAGATGGAGAMPGTGAALVESAKKYLGVPYVWGGESLAEGGLDCSGLVQLAMSDIGVSVPRVAREQMKIGTEVPSLAQAQPGDLIVTRGGGHIGIYAGGNTWIHAPYPGEEVKLAEMTTAPTTIRRVLPTSVAA